MRVSPLADITPEMVAEAIVTTVFLGLMLVGAITAYVIHRRSKKRHRRAIEESRRFAAEPWSGADGSD